MICSGDARRHEDRHPAGDARSLNEWIANGVRLGWLLDPEPRQVYVYRPGASVERLDVPAELSADPLLPDPDNYPEELWGIEDPRIVYLPDIEQYAITYTAYSRNGPLVALALTRDFRTFERCGPIMPPEDKDGAFFPRKFDGRWALIHRPVPNHPGAKANMWLSFTPDLKHYGDHQVLFEARSGAYWDAGKIGLSPPPIETPEGWLVIYHGVRHTPSGALYRGGLALLELDDPRIVIARGDEWVIGPEESYELTGDVPRVVFPCGFIHDELSGDVRIYYGAADTCIAVATANVADLLGWLRAEPNLLTNPERADDRGRRRAA